MKKLIFITLVLLSTTLFAGQREFCEGFKEGYKTIKGNLVVVPVCPVGPVTPVGSTDYREGLKAGMKRAKKKSY